MTHHGNCNMPIDISYANDAVGMTYMHNLHGLCQRPITICQHSITDGLPKLALHSLQHNRGGTTRRVCIKKPERVQNQSR